jgi:tetratricopeptide (TPR) repeat protein
MTAKKKKSKKEVTKKSSHKDKQEFDWLHQTAFWGLALLLFFPPYFRGLFFAPEQEKALMFATLVFWLTFLWRWLQNDHKFLRGPLDWFALALPVVYIISTFTAVNKGYAIDEVVKNILYFLTYWSASRLVRNEEDVHKLLHVIYVSAIGVALAGLATATGIVHIKDGFNVSHIGGFISSTFQYHNALATYLGAVFFIGIYLWHRSFGRQPYFKVDTEVNTGQAAEPHRGLGKLMGYLYACGNLLLLAVLIGTKSRGGLLVFALVFAIYLLGTGYKQRFYALLLIGYLGAVSYIVIDKFIILAQDGNYGTAWLWMAGGILLAVAGQMLLNLLQNFVTNKWAGNSKKYLVAFASIVTVVLATGVIWLSGKPGVIEKITSFDYLWTAYHRIHYMESAIDMIKERPVTGWGGGGWKEAYEAFLNFRYTTREAHSYYFQVGVETGLAGIAAVFGIWISYILLAYRLFRENIDNQFRRQLAWLFVVIFLMIGGHALIDFDLSLSALSLVLWSAFGMTTALAMPVESKQHIKQQRALKNMSIAIATVIMLIIFTVSGILTQANSFANTGYKLLGSNLAAKGIEYLERASSSNPFKAEYHIVLSKVYVTQGKLKAALEEAETAVNRSQYFFNTRNNYVQIALAAGENKLAARENERILDLAPNNITMYEEYARNYLNLGMKELQSGNQEDAKTYLNKVLSVSHLLSQQEKTLSDIDKKLWEGPLLKDTDKIYLVKGQAAYCLGKFCDSLGYLQHAAQTQNSNINSQALVWQALVHEKNGNQAESKKLINQARKLNPQVVQNYQALKSIPVL